LPKLWTEGRIDRLLELLSLSPTVEEAYAAARAEFGQGFSDSHARKVIRKKTGRPPGDLIATTKEAVEKRDEVALLRRSIRESRARIRVLERETERSAMIRELLGDLNDSPFRAPSWLAPVDDPPTEHGTPTLLLSDIHHGEVVRSEEVSGANAFNIEISRRRLQRVFRKTVSMLHGAPISPPPGGWPGIVVACAGDMLSGNIHEEIRQTNEIPVLAAVVDLAEQLAAGFTMLADAFGEVYAPWVVGNHGRLDRKPRIKGGACDNYEWILGHYLKQKLAGDNRISIEIADGFSLSYRVHSTRYLLMHGDGFKGGGGWAGPTLPFMRGDHKLRKQRASMAQWTGLDVEYNELIFGHFHTYFPLRGIVCNGSLKGFDAYAQKLGFSFEPPQQALWITHPRLGATLHCPVVGEKPSEKGTA
jgi:hypothetical protein